MNKEQAINIIKQFLDAAIKNGVCPNLETTAAIIQAWNYILNQLNKNENG